MPRWRRRAIRSWFSLDEDANLHRVQYDYRHDRFWVIQDEGSGDTAMISNGVVTVLPDGTVEQENLFALESSRS